MPTDPLSPTELAVIRMWTDILGVAPGSGDDDFFDLGGESLRLVQFLQRVWQEYQVEMDIAELFVADVTVINCAAAIDRATAAMARP